MIGLDIIENSDTACKPIKQLCDLPLVLLFVNLKMMGELGPDINGP